MQALLDRCGLKQQIGLIGLIGVVIMLVIATLIFVSNRHQAQKQQVMDRAAAANDLVSAIDIGMLQARRHEKDFFLRSEAKYIDLQQQALQKVGHALGDLAAAVSGTDDAGLVTTLTDQVGRYGQQFLEVASLRQKVGLNETLGLMGRMRAAVHAIEETLQTRHDPELEVLMLTMRRHEKDFLARQDPKYADNLKKTAEDFTATLATAALPESVKADMVVKLKDYTASFLAVAAANGEIAQASQKMSAIYAELEPVQDRLNKQTTAEYEVAKAEIAAARASLVTFLAWLLGGSVLLLVVCVIVISGAISRPLIALTGMMKRLASGDHGIEVGHLTASNEIGEMSRAVEVFKRNAVEKLRMDEAEQRRLEAERAAAEAQRLKEQGIGREIAALIEAVSRGELTSRLDLSDKEGFYKTMSEGINSLTDTVQTAIADIARVLGALAEGDLDQRITKDYRGAFDRLKNDVNTTSETLAEIVGNISLATTAISSAASEVSAGSTDLAERTEQQASSLEETAASMEELGATVRTAAGNAQRANKMAEGARRAGEKGGGVAGQAVEAMKRIDEASRKITEIIGVIDEIAFQTNLLALNAAVEAARAGDAGKGFAVVAQEVRLLAQRSAQASKEIKGLILNSDQQVKTGVELVKQAGESLTGIVSSVQQVAALISEIAQASAEQATALDQINSAVAAMDEMTQKNAALVEETTAAAQSMSGQATELQGLVGFFKLSHRDAANTRTERRLSRAA